MLPGATLMMGNLGIQDIDTALGYMGPLLIKGNLGVQDIDGGWGYLGLLLITGNLGINECGVGKYSYADRLRSP